MNLKTAVVVFCVVSSPAFAAEVKLICEDKTEATAWYRKDLPARAPDIYAADNAAQSIRQLQGELQKMKLSSVNFTETEIHFSQSGYINDPRLTETFKTTINRVTGNWIRDPHYLDAEGRRISGPALEQLARSLNLSGPFGIRQRSDNGGCLVGDFKF